MNSTWKGFSSDTLCSMIEPNVNALKNDLKISLSWNRNVEESMSSCQDIILPDEVTRQSVGSKSQTFFEIQRTRSKVAKVHSIN